MPPCPAGSDAAWVAAMLAVDSAILGGVTLRGRPGPQRDEWLTWFRGLLDPRAPWKRIPLHADDDRLLGGLDVASSLSAGRPVAASGLLTEANGGFAVLPMAERMRRSTAAHICAALDHREIRLERDGITRRIPSRFAVIAMDESLDDEAGLSPDLEDRLAFSLSLDDEPEAGLPDARYKQNEIARAREALPRVVVDDDALGVLCGAALALGIESLRGPWFAQQAARVAAALDGRNHVSGQDITVATRLVLLPRAIQWPAESETENELPPDEQEHETDRPREKESQAPDELVLEAVKASLPPDLLARLQASAARRKGRAVRGRFGLNTASKRRGRPMGARRGDPTGGKRLHISATLKAAAPWQKIRRSGQGSPADRRTALSIRPQDFHVARYKARRETVTIFAVDASGSSAVHRLAEAKGAIELMLAQCYVRRDQVALIAFRGDRAETLLPPTRALARARRELAALPGGGGTPLATGLDAARELAADVERRGMTAVIVLMTDGRANIARDGTPGHEKAQQEAMAASKLFRMHDWRCVLIDTSVRPRPRARDIADSMGAQYLPLPRADASALSSAIQLATAA